jgi:uncharacterized coiled-coil DUF342 family protein
MDDIQRVADDHQKVVDGITAEIQKQADEFRKIGDGLTAEIQKRAEEFQKIGHEVTKPMTEFQIRMNETINFLRQERMD